MPATVPALTVKVTKLSSSGNFQFLIQDANGAVRFPVVLLSADMATAAALTSGNSATFTYPQDGPPTRNDYSNSLWWES